MNTSKPIPQPAIAIDHAYLTESVTTLERQVADAQAKLSQATERLFTLRGALGFARVLLNTQPKPAPKPPEPAPAAAEAQTEE